MSPPAAQATDDSLVERAATGLAIGAGAVLGTAFRVAGELPHRRKPLHPRGRVTRARLHRYGADHETGSATGVAFVDTRRTDEVLVRESRSVGLPTGLPDVNGLALRVTEPDGSRGDVLFSTTGWGRLTRYVLTPSRTTYGRPMTTLLPYRTAAGPLLLGLREVRPRLLELACSVAGGPWRSFADLELGVPVRDEPSEDGQDADVSFDPVLNRPPGLEQYDVVRRLREPAYRGARASRE